jgi:hypothetical protein
MNEYMHLLREEAPECMAVNPNRMVLVIGSIIIQLCLQYPVQIGAKRFFMISLPKSFPVGTKMRESKAELLAERGYKFIIHIVTTIMLFWILKNSNFLHRNLLGDQDPVFYFKNYPC